MSGRKFWLLDSSGEVRRSPCGIVEAATKREAERAFLLFAVRCMIDAPAVRVKDGALQLAYWAAPGCINVDAGPIERGGHDGTGWWFPACSGSPSCQDVRAVPVNAASFDYYGSAVYREARGVPS